MTPEEAERIETLTARCEALRDPELRSDVLDLLRLVMQFHAEGVMAMIQCTADAPHLEALLAAWRRNPEITALLEVHNLSLPQRESAAADFIPLAALSHST